LRVTCCRTPRRTLVATGFHRNTLINEEGGTDQEQFRVEAVVDRVSTTGAAWLGLTIGCAQCHAHKYDPITQRDFYQVFAVFNSCDEPNIPVPSPEQLTEQKRLDAEVADAEKPLRELDAELLKGLPIGSGTSRHSRTAVGRSSTQPFGKPKRERRSPRSTAQRCSSISARRLTTSTL